LIDTARLLAASGKKKPNQVVLRRAVSTAYYALFHALARNCADLLIGGSGSARSKHAWVEVYRSLSHGTAKSACSNLNMMSKFPIQISSFAFEFVKMQQKRHDADYNPHAKFYKSDALADINRCEGAIADLQLVPTKDRRAFASWVLLKDLKRN
jgi:uncharacterized protein (UPF0332 family)